jgi:transposase
VREIRRQYTAEFKRETLELARSSERSLAAIERELGLPRGTIHSWIAAEERDGEEAFPGHGKRKPTEAKSYDAERRVLELEQEVAILKKALGILAQPNRNGLR